jgi:hypothetical protein
MIFRTPIFPKRQGNAEVAPIFCFVAFAFCFVARAVVGRVDRTATSIDLACPRPRRRQWPESDQGHGNVGMDAPVLPPAGEWDGGMVPEDFVRLKHEEAISGPMRTDRRCL